jgi:hypothetical protein
MVVLKEFSYSCSPPFQFSRGRMKPDREMAPPPLPFFSPPPRIRPLPLPPIPWDLHRKKRFTSFPSPAGMSLTKLPLGRNNSVMTSLFPPWESLVVTSRLGTGNSRTFFYGVWTHGSMEAKVSHQNHWLKRDIQE